MNLAEHTVWAIMTGGLLSLVLLAVADTLVTRNLGAVRNMLLIIAISFACIFLSGLPQTLFPGLPERLVMAIEAGFGLLSSALGLRLLGIWTGGDREDHLVYRLSVWGAYGMLIASMVMAVLATLVPLQEFQGLLMLTAGLNAIAVVLCTVIAVRAAMLGDPLARWLVAACVLLMVLTTGLYLHALKVEGLGLGLQVLTASSAVLFVLLVMVLIIVRNRQQRQLARLSRLEMGWDPVTGLPTGAKLLGEVEHAFWRAGRLRGQCIVVAVYLNNLYELGDTLGRTSDHQILAATAARIRRAAGFRCVVGLYHPRCFVVVFSIDRKRHFDGAFVTRLQGLVTQPLQLVGSKAQRLSFVAQVGIALRTVLPDQTVAQDVIDTVEHEAMEQVRRPAAAADADRVDTTW